MKTRKTASCAFRIFYIFILFSAFISFASVSSAATYDVYGGTKAYWPDGSWIPVPSLGDPDDGVTERLDFVGDTLTSGGDGTNYAFYKYADSLYIYFRVRVDAGTWGGIKGLDPGGEWTDNIWIMLDANADNDPDYAIAWDSNTWDPGVSEPHGLEFQIIDKSSSIWSGTRFDDIDRLDSKKLVEAGTGPGKCNCECGRGNNCWHTDIPYSGGTGYVRIVDEQPTTTWGSTMFIDIAVTWSYLVSASSKANECNPNLPVLSAYGTWKLQMGSRNNANDHAAISTDVGANSNPTDALVWSDETKPLPPDPVLTISKSAPLDVTVDPAGTGTIMQYTGVLTNTTQAYAYDVVMVDTLPGGATFVASSHNAVYDSILNTVTWQLGTMGPGTSIPGWLAVKVDASTPNETVLTNKFSVTWKDFDSSDFGPATAAADTTVYTHPQLSVKKSGPVSAIHNEQFSHNITIRNTGDSPAFHIALEDALPPGLAYVGSSPSGTYNSGPPAMVIWNDLGGLEANSFKIVTVTVKVNDTVPNATVLMDTLNLIWEDSLENSYGPVISSADTTIYTLPHLEITKSGPLEAEAGSMITYKGEMTNTGGTAAGNVVLVDSLPSGVTFISSSQSAVYDPVSNTVTWNLGTIGPGVSLPGWLTVQINGDVTDASLLTNTFTATGEDALGNPLPEAKAKAFTTVYTHPLLAIEKSGPSTSYPGHTVTYTIQVTNNGGSAALDVTLMDSLPNGLTYQSSNPAGTHAAGLVTWNLGPMISDACQTITLTVTVDASAADGTYPNLAQVTWKDMSTVEYGPASVIKETNVHTHPFLAVSKTGPSEAYTGETLSYTIQVSNIGGTSALNVTLSDNLPIGLSYQSSNPAGNHTGGIITWDLDTILPSESKTVTVSVIADVTIGNGTLLKDTAVITWENGVGEVFGPVTATADTTIYTCPGITLIPDPGPLPDGMVGVSYQQVISAEGGTGPYTYELTRGTLPDGLNLIPGSIVISGIPSAEGTWEFMIVATDEGHGCAIAHEYSITITAVPATIPALTGWGITIIFSLFSVTSILWIKRRSFNK